MTLIELLNTFIANKVADINICLPAKIVSYEFKTRKAVVKPLLNVKYNDDQVLENPLIYNVPVVHPAAGGASITFPVKEGNTVLLIFSQKSLEEWLRNGQLVTPDDPRQNDLTDAIAIIGFKPFSEQVPAESADDFVMDYDGSTITLHPEGIVDVDASEVNITSPTVNINATDVNVSGKITASNVDVSGEMKSASAKIGGKEFAAHMHSGVTSGGSVTGAVA
jgi:hypothetical protein